jgi:hypothetical protein
MQARVAHLLSSTDICIALLAWLIMQNLAKQTIDTAHAAMLDWAGPELFTLLSNTLSRTLPPDVCNDMCAVAALLAARINSKSIPWSKKHQTVQ